MKRLAGALKRAAIAALSAAGAVDLRDVIGVGGFGLLVLGVALQFGGAVACMVAGAAMVAFAIQAARK